MEQFGIPTGYKFQPSEIDLVNHYLLPKVFNGKLADDQLIPEVNFYANGPIWLSERYYAQGVTKQGDQEWYFFTKWDKKYKMGKKPNRVAGDGFWRASSCEKEIKYQNEVVAKSRVLVYNYKKDHGRNEKTNWILKELFVNNRSNDTKFHDWVLHVMHKSNHSEKISKALSNRRKKRDDTTSNGVAVDDEQQNAKRLCALPPNSTLQIEPPKEHSLASSSTLQIERPIEHSLASSSYSPVAPLEIETNDTTDFAFYLEELLLQPDDDTTSNGVGVGVDEEQQNAASQIELPVVQSLASSSSSPVAPLEIETRDTTDFAFYLEELLLQPDDDTTSNGVGVDEEQQNAASQIELPVVQSLASSSYSRVAPLEIETHDTTDFSLEDLLLQPEDDTTSNGVGVDDEQKNAARLCLPPLASQIELPALQSLASSSYSHLQPENQNKNNNFSEELTSERKKDADDVLFDNLMEDTLFASLVSEMIPMKEDDAVIDSSNSNDNLDQWMKGNRFGDEANEKMEKDPLFDRNFSLELLTDESLNNFLC